MLASENLKFVILGMAIVLVFQFIMKRFKGIDVVSMEKVPENTSTAHTLTTTDDNLDATEDAHHVAAIIAAITEFRKQS